jgi:hypothetical protein
MTRVINEKQKSQGVTARPGARYGPRGIRQGSQRKAADFAWSVYTGLLPTMSLPFLFPSFYGLRSLTEIPVRQARMLFNPGPPSWTAAMCR